MVIKQIDDNFFHCDDNNELAFDPETYDSRMEMWEEIIVFLKICLTNGQIATIHQEDFGIVVVKYNYADPTYGTSRPIWLDTDEIKCVMEARQHIVDNLTLNKINLE